MMFFACCLRCPTGARSESAEAAETAEELPTLFHGCNPDAEQGKPKALPEDCEKSEVAFHDAMSDASPREPEPAPTAPVEPELAGSALAEHVEEEPPRSKGLLGPTLRGFEAAAQEIDPATGLAVDLVRQPLLDGLEAYATALDIMGGSMGSYLQANVTKMRRSKANADLGSFRQWMLSELPVHAATSYKGYVDDSAWMANLWIGWTLEFFVELFAQIHQGDEMKAAADAAYKKSLTQHHNMFQRAAFMAAVKKLPARQEFLKTLVGDTSDGPVDVMLDLAEFVRLGRIVVKFSAQINKEVEQAMKQARNKS